MFSQHALLVGVWQGQSLPPDAIDLLNKSKSISLDDKLIRNGNCDFIESLSFRKFQVHEYARRASREFRTSNFKFRNCSCHFTRCSPIKRQHSFRLHTLSAARSRQSAEHSDALDVLEAVRQSTGESAAVRLTETSSESFGKHFVSFDAPIAWSHKLDNFW